MYDHDTQAKNECIVSVQLVNDAVQNLKLRKSDGDSDLMSDNIIFASQRSNVYISLLFSSMMSHGYMPGEMLKSVIIPIPKDMKGDLSTSENYRGISLCSSLIKLFELVILKISGCNLCTSDLQFAFKKQHSTVICASVFKETVSYYLSRDTDVYCCFLDATKAFDRLMFGKLFKILLYKNIPAAIVRILLDMYERQSITVSWNNRKSESFTATGQHFVTHSI